METTQRMLKGWIAELSIMHIAHHKAATFYSKCHLLLGIAVVIVGALIGLAIGDAIFGKNSDGAARLTVALGVASAILAGIQTFLGAEGRARNHHASAAAFGGVRRELEQLVYVGAGIPTEERANDVRKNWNAALLAAPNLPAFIHDPVRQDFPMIDKEGAHA